MHLILCVDDRMGLGFARRRHSTDSALRRDLLALVGQRPLWMTPYTAGQFSPLPENARVCETLPGQAGPGDYVFLELQSPEGWDDAMEDVILYRWNRHYPSDAWLPQALLQQRQLVSSLDFPGTSHENITREVYRHG